MNPIWNWLKDAGTQAVLIFITACAAIGALVLTWYFGRKSLTKRDLTPLEQNTASTHKHLADLNERARQQENADALANRAKWVPISASGESEVGKPLPIVLSTTQANVYFMRVELLSENHNEFGHADCIQPSHSNSARTAEFPPDQVQKWRAAGVPVDRDRDTTRHLLRVWMRISPESRDVAREMPVTLSSGVRGGGKDAPGTHVAIYKIEGAV